MEEYTNKALEKLLEKAEELDWSYNLYKQTYNGETDTYAEMEKYSPAGEDFCMTIFFDEADPLHSFTDNVRSEYENFDPDEHAELWIERRWKNGVPETIRELIDDADAIKEMLDDLAIALENEIYLPFC